jgi:hypothetical protein
MKKDEDDIPYKQVAEMREHVDRKILKAVAKVAGAGRRVSKYAAARRQRKRK